MGCWMMTGEIKYLKYEPRSQPQDDCESKDTGQAGKGSQVGFGGTENS